MLGTALEEQGIVGGDHAELVMAPRQRIVQSDNAILARRPEEHTPQYKLEQRMMTS